MAKRVRFLIFCVIVLGIVLIFYATRSSHFTGDSLDYAVSIRTGHDLFHPHHILFNPVIRLILVSLSSFGLSVDAVQAAQAHNILWAVITILALSLFVKRLFRSLFAGMSAGLLFMVLLGFWEYTTQVEVYVPAMGCLAVILMIISRSWDSPLTYSQKIGIVLFFALSVLYHQSCILFFIPLGYYLVIREKEKKEKKRSLFLLFLSLVLISVVYIIVFLKTAEDVSLTGFISYIFSYAFNPSPNWGTMKNVNLHGVGLLLLAQIRAMVYIPQHLYVLMAFVSAALMGFLCVWNAVMIFRREIFEKIRSFLFVFIAINFLFNLWWSPWEKELLIINLLPVAALFFVTLHDLSAKLRSSRNRFFYMVLPFACLIFTLGYVNFRHSILPSCRSRGKDFAEAARLNPHIPRDGSFLTYRGVQQNLRYYFNNEAGWETEIILLCFYRHIQMLEEYKDIVHRPRLVMLDLISPENEIAKIFSGYLAPKEWFRFMEWLFNFEYDERGRMTSCHQYEVSLQRPTYLLLSPEKKQVNGLREFFLLLDQSLRDQNTGDAEPFFPWYKSHSRISPPPPPPPTSKNSYLFSLEPLTP